MNRTWNIVDAEDDVYIPIQQVSVTKRPLPNQAMHASTLHVTCLSFSFCRMVLFVQALRKLGLKSLYTLCRLRMKHDNN